MNRILTVIASFITMLCIGSIYAWSIVAAELIKHYNFSASESQIVFGSVIFIFPVTMIFVGLMSKKFNPKYFGYISGILFSAGYFLASFSEGNFWPIYIGVGVIGGIGTGFGYWISLTSSVKSFPERKGLITGIAAAGFGLGAVFMSEISQIILSNGNNILEFFRIVAIVYGLIILFLANFIFQHKQESADNEAPPKVSYFVSSNIFKKLFLGIFLGTFAGFLIIGSLKIIGSQYSISNDSLVLGVALFAFANFSGRLGWGFLSDHIGASLAIFFALLFQAVSILSLILFPLTDTLYLALSVLIGFGFGGNFVLFAKESAQVFGVKNLGLVYPYVFIGSAFAGIAGPFSGGLLFDISGSYNYAIILASTMSVLGSLIFLIHFNKSRGDKSSINKL